MQQGTRVRYKLRPSSLLWLDNLCEAGKELRARCRDVQSCDPDLMRQLADDARRLRARGNASSYATVLVCLADRFREAGELILARECCERAERLFSPYEDCRHEHNHAVALYALGRVLESLHLYQEAITSYDEALEAFRKARAEWRWNPECAQSRGDQCARAVREITEVRAELARARSLPASQASGRVPLQVFVTSAGRPLAASEDVEEWVEVEETVAATASCVLRVKGDSMVDADIHDGDLVLIQRTAAWPPNGQIVVVRIDGMVSESVLKRVYQQPDHICLHPANDAHPFIVLLPASTRKEDIEQRYAQSDPKRLLEFYPEIAAHCAGWYCGKLQ